MSSHDESQARTVVDTRWDKNKRKTHSQRKVINFNVPKLN